MEAASLDRECRFFYSFAAMDRLFHTAVRGAGALLVTLFWVSDSGGIVRAELPSPAATPAEAAEGVLVLNSGGVVVGTVSRDGDRYVVVGFKSQLRIATTDVAFACGTLAEAYELKRRQIVAPTADAHLELAEWCLRHNLTAQAAQELAYIRELEPGHPKLALIERRLSVANRPPKEIKPKPAVMKPAEAEPLANGVKELDPYEALARSLPDEVVQRFTRKVQPLLVNNCTTAGCHQPAGEQEFQLDRAILHGMANRRSTMRNLAATLALVDGNSPHLSPLLTVPRRAHGGSDEPPLGPRQDQQFEQLVEWVALVTQEASLPSSSVAKKEVQGTMPVGKASEVLPASYEEELAPEKRKPRVQRGARLQSTRATDPFDPELFNRRHAVQNAAAPAAH